MTSPLCLHRRFPRPYQTIPLLVLLKTVALASSETSHVRITRWCHAGLPPPSLPLSAPSGSCAAAASPACFLAPPLRSLWGQTASRTFISDAIFAIKPDATAKDGLKYEPGGSDDDGGGAFGVLARRVASVLVRSDLKANECNDGASTGWTAWADEGSASELRQCLSGLRLSDPVAVLARAAEAKIEDEDGSESVRTGGGGQRMAEALGRRDRIRSWTAWINGVPAPMVLDLSDELRAAVGARVSDNDIKVRARQEDREEPFQDLLRVAFGLGSY